MSISRFLKQNPTFSEADTIAEWCRPLALLQIPYFCHAHIDKQNRLTFICNYPEFGCHYLENGFYQYDIHMKEDFRQSQVIVWDLFERSSKSRVMHDDFKAFGRGHTFTIVQPREDGCHYFHFASYDGTSGASQSYLQRLDVLEQFISYYLDKLSRSLSVQKKLAVKIPLDLSLGGYSLENAPAILDTNDFYQLTMHQRQHVNGGSEYLTLGEISCLYWLALGKTMEETAILLDISPRTVKAHIHHAKEKLHCQSLFQLGMYFKDRFQLLSKMGWMPKEQET
ncbi:helix-turn-helix transcriptional regulator [Legionella sp. W05-934-2]|jgi:DNA-binding CsgD family transcriptional regulator|uniref:helix-turn-helix transcriptional regulator n=1 Tax=Legionella sp. W05-934-2 TaxID=1198649 RepID=UPI003462B755